MRSSSGSAPAPAAPTRSGLHGMHSSASVRVCAQQGPGQLMELINSSTAPGKEHIPAIKGCVNQAVASVFPNNHATVQAQGSVAKGTSTHTSDVDFFVRLDNSIPTVTKNQRLQVLHHLKENVGRKGLQYTDRLGENRINLRDGQALSTGCPLPDVDIIFQQYKGDGRKPPNSRAMADTHAGQQVVKHLKLMATRERYANLPAPKSARLEEFVQLVRAELTSQQGVSSEELEGKHGFTRLLKASLEKVGGLSQLTANQAKYLADAGMRSGDQWMHAARKELNANVLHL